MTDYPDFDEVLRRLQKFVAMQGAPERIVFVTPEEVLLSEGRLRVCLPEAAASLVRARDAYQQAVNNRQGVLRAGLCRLENQLYSYVYGPTSEEEAMALLYPDGLKLSLPAPLPKGYPVGKWWWRLLRALERRRPEILVNKPEMFK